MSPQSSSWLLISSKAAAYIGIDAFIPSVVFPFLALVAVLLRWYSRACLTRRVGCEDIFVTIALLLSMAMAGVTGGEFALDIEKSASTNEEMVLLKTTMKLVFAHSIIFHLAVNLVKISIVLQYIQVFKSIRSITFVCYTFIFMIAGAFGWGVFGVVFLCYPVPKYWDPQLPDGECMDAMRHFESTAICGVLLDFAIWVLPMTLWNRLNLERRQGLGLMFVFGLGGFVCVVSVLRLVLVQHAIRDGDVPKAGTYAVVWSAIELNVAIICASLLVMKPVMVRFWPGLFVEPPSARDQARAFRAIASLTLLTYGEELGEERKEVLSRHGTSPITSACPVDEVGETDLEVATSK
ncbi:hypothetical protein BS50DRAFT_627651 [Corynespora cassiicola Philippines]|uniref:Rhodopsin domain-containing protein n=1 Tax=Corynespora cassiicola Philippines TaxID=1448308 RepID=A0A2T2P9H7_CORCC|nr:hypothetical protein BS50DRAFT_627651 [Corynespora cassiicola Philippines]